MDQKGTEKRRSGRVPLSIPIQVTGTDLAGEYFTEQSKTVLLSEHGAAIIVSRKLPANEKIVVRCPGANKEAAFRVVGQIGPQAGGYVYGIALVDPNASPWGIEFPPESEAQEAFGRALLQCDFCGSQEVTQLDELEFPVFLANMTITLYCKHCGNTTQWKEAHVEPGRELEASPKPLHATRVVDEGAVAPEIIGLEEQPRTQNERKEHRAKTAIRACIRRAGFPDEVVVTENVSRGGFCFKGPKKYVKGSKVEVALPYTPDAANLFVPAHIERVRAISSEGLNEYGVAYLKRP